MAMHFMQVSSHFETQSTVNRHSCYTVNVYAALGEALFDFTILSSHCSSWLIPQLKKKSNDKLLTG